MNRTFERHPSSRHAIPISNRGRALRVIACAMALAGVFSATACVTAVEPEELEPPEEIGEVEQASHGTFCIDYYYDPGSGQTVGSCRSTCYSHTTLKCWGQQTAYSTVECFDCL